MTRPLLRLLLSALAILSLALFVSACGDDDEEESSAGAPTTVATTPPGEVRQFPVNTTMGKIQKKGEIVVGVKYDVPPFGFKNPRTDTIEGFDVDFAKAIARDLGVKLKPVEALSDNRIPFIEKGTVDLILSTMTINSERAEQIGFTDPYFVARGRILQKKGGDIGGVEDLAGKKVCTALGSTYEETLKKEAPRAELRLVDSYSECLELIQNGAVDAVSTDDVILTGMIIQDDSLELVGTDLTIEPYGGGFKKGDTAFATFLNNSLNEWIERGEWTRAYTKWLGRFTGEEQPPPNRTLKQVLEGMAE